MPSSDWKWIYFLWQCISWIFNIYSYYAFSLENELKIVEWRTRLKQICYAARIEEFFFFLIFTNLYIQMSIMYICRKYILTFKVSRRDLTGIFYETLEYTYNLKTLLFTTGSIGLFQKEFLILFFFKPCNGFLLWSILQTWRVLKQCKKNVAHFIKFMCTLFQKHKQIGKNKYEPQVHVLKQILYVSQECSAGMGRVYIFHAKSQRVVLSLSALFQKLM